MRVSFVIATAITAITTVGVSADRPLKPQSQAGTASFTVNLDGTVTIDIMWEDAAHALVSGEDGKYTTHISYTSNYHSCTYVTRSTFMWTIIYLNCVTITIIISEC